ncbi:MAG: hypothetical protein K0R12_809 [Gammaproteobacteria bacterium]|jgi:hypothetical protein|nr:hypothetical protein [Gammaproteobacteria bacterium]
MKVTNRFIFLLISIIALILSASSQAEIYRSVDKNGNMVFSDSPSDTGQKVELAPTQVYTPPTVEKSTTNIDEAGADTAPTDSNTTQTQNKPYESVSMTGVEDQSTLPHNIPISVTISSIPALQAGDSYNVLIDGNSNGPAQTNGAFSIPVTGFDRGQHTLQAVVVDSNNNVLKQSNPVTFFIFQRSLLVNPQ